MQALFLTLVRMSISAGWMILAVILVRPFLKKAPRFVLCLLWGLVSLRLMIPAAIRSRVSLVPSETVLTEGLRQTAPVITAAPEPSVQAAAKAALSPAAVMCWVWLAGVILMAAYALFSYFRLRRLVRASLRKEKNVFLCDSIPSPFILGVFRPKIYLPSMLSYEQTHFVLAHEHAHLRRGDHLWKPLGYLLLCLYWFNPLCWAAYILFCRDMEIACDERVVSPMEKQERCAYSSALLECSIRGHLISACPLAFGEVSVKSRIRNVLNYRKPTVWAAAISCVICVVLVCCFLTDPVHASKPDYGAPCVLIAEAKLREEPDGRMLPTQNTGSFVYFQMGHTDTHGESWAQIYCPDSDTTGWVQQNTLTFLTGCGPLLYTSDAPTKLYSAPIETADLNGQLKPMEPIEITQQAATGSAQYLWVYGTAQDSHVSGWLQIPVEIKQGTSGNILDEPFSELAASTPCEVVTTVNMRRDPDLLADTVAVLKLGDSVSVLRWETVFGTNWCYVQSDNADCRGWVLSEYLKQISDSVPTIIDDPAVDIPSDLYSLSAAADVRSSPSHQARNIGRLEAGSIVSILRCENVGGIEWCYAVSEENMLSGWIEAEAIGGISVPAETVTVTETADELYTVTSATELRSSPSHAARVPAKLEAGSIVRIQRRENVAGAEWCYVECADNGITGWIEAENLSAT